MDDFKRGLSDDFVNKLNEEYKKGGWWKILADDKDLFIGIRNEYLNVYYLGNSLMKLSFNNRKLEAETHYKYLLIPDAKDPYIKIIDGKIYMEVDRSREFFFNELSQTIIKKLKQASKPFAGLEKSGVHQIWRKNPNVIDLEIALTKKAEEEEIAGQGLIEVENEKKRAAPRMDFAALLQRDDKMELVFYEAKDFSYHSALRKADKNGKPKAVDQINEYEDLLAKKKISLKDSYKKLISNIAQLKGKGSLEQRRQIANNALKIDFKISCLPKLVIFGFDQDQKDGDAWRPHHEKLIKFLGDERILAWGSANGKIK